MRIKYSEEEIRRLFYRILAEEILENLNLEEAIIEDRNLRNLFLKIWLEKNRNPSGEENPRECRDS